MKIKKGRQDKNSGYIRVFNNIKLGQLISRVQATVISNGSELERIILSKTNNINNLDEFIDNINKGVQRKGKYVCPKKVSKKSKYHSGSLEPDLIIFILGSKNKIYVIELKDGDAFDTKKSEVERNSLEKFTKNYVSKLSFEKKFYLCSFNQTNKNQIVDGLKNTFTKDEVLTGKELCNLLNIDYEEIIEKRKNDATANYNYFIDELLKIKGVKNKIIKKLKLESDSSRL